jgi:hypothetical protein
MTEHGTDFSVFGLFGVGVGFSVLGLFAHP